MREGWGWDWGGESEAVRAPDVLLHRDALLFLLGVREVGGAVTPQFSNVGIEAFFSC